MHLYPVSSFLGLLFFQSSITSSSSSTLSSSSSCSSSTSFPITTPFSPASFSPSCFSSFPLLLLPLSFGVNKMLLSFHFVPFTNLTVSLLCVLLLCVSLPHYHLFSNEIDTLTFKKNLTAVLFHLFLHIL